MNKNKLKIMILMGGPSSEHEISLATAQNVITALDPRKYLVRPILIDKAGRWFLAPSFPTPLLFSGGVSENLLHNNFRNKSSEFRVSGVNPRGRRIGKDMSTSSKRDASEILNLQQKDYFAKGLKSKGLIPTTPQDALNKTSGRPDVVFIAMHGAYGEDGRIQSLLELAGIPYTGSGVLASALAMDKVRSAQLLIAQGLNVPKFTAFKKIDWNKNKKEILANIIKFTWPLVIKPVNLGSSVGVSIVQNKKGLGAALKKAWQKADYVMAQKFIKGREVTCGVLDDPKTGKPFALPPTEIIPKTQAFFDYRAKYTPGASEEITPAGFPQKVLDAIQKNAVTAHEALDCKGISRTDMIISLNTKTQNSKSKIYVLELNTIPGMTATSLLPQAAKAAGIGFPKLLDIIINRAFQTK